MKILKSYILIITVFVLLALVGCADSVEVVQSAEEPDVPVLDSASPRIQVNELAENTTETDIFEETILDIEKLDDSVSNSTNQLTEDNINMELSWSGVWQYTYNERDVAQIYIDNETEWGFDFNLYVVEYKDDGDIKLGGYSTHADKKKEGGVTFSFSDEETPICFNDSRIVFCDGSLVIEDNKLHIKYDNLQFMEQGEEYIKNNRTELPLDYKKISDEESAEAMYIMPFFAREPNLFSTLYYMSHEEIDEIFGEPSEIINSHFYGEENPDIMMSRIYV